jgi:tripartite-type tricarboxylate transporter receptor subunit TctC
MPKRTTALAAIGALAALLVPVSGRAQDAIASFYKDKTVTIVIGSTVGGGVDVYGRLVARHLGRHIPGHPTVIPQNMPGAGSIAAASHIYTVAAKDGTQIGTVLSGAIFDPLLASGPRRFEPTRFNYIGNANSETGVCVVRADAPAKTFAETFNTEILVGGTGPGSALTTSPVFLRNFFNTKIRLIAGYPGSREIALAVEKGELHGICGLNFTSARQQYRDLLTGTGPFRVILQEDVTPSPMLAKLGVPLVMAFAKTEEERQVLATYFGQGPINRPFILPPDTPADRVAALRKAFDAMLKDPELIAEAQRQQLDVDGTSGTQVQEVVAKLYATPPHIVDRLKQAMGLSK